MSVNREFAHISFHQTLEQPAPVHVALPDLIGGFSLAIDLAEGKPLRHAQSISFLADHVAQALCIGGSERDALYYAALLHDIGVSSQNQLCPLCQVFEEEGKLDSVTSLIDADQALHRRWERWDGSGPLALRGQAIPLVARILAVAVAAERVGGEHRDFWNWRTRVEDYFQRDTGVFDPAIVAALKALLRDRAFCLDLFAFSQGRVVDRFRPEETITLAGGTMHLLGKAFARFIDVKTPFTADHSRNVADWSRRIAGAMALPEARKHQIYLAGLLHDLGKIAIPKAILEKAGPLTAKEFDLVRNHPYYTACILNQIPALETIALWASAHHERLDGSGYFLGITGEMLPMEARIIAVADVYEALAADRPYRKGLETAAIQGMLKEMAYRRHLDADVVEALDGLLGGQCC
ncbi:metal dependent phosphohydrolase, putative [Heliomicrobium modesticaldum Ice1]|uniref:Metal dependent phosphohydrolase, putative n=1 Tax=Heliobacterium modesticaldum (strain ATCC 51547 / Ice1) TaxID=498761 RepID=B0TFE1_HELMI|nr:HD-GYP domain-containing protein [Heliomicrobium modesticaldum]ABZ83040.1 metal dependent phosphohydrolase, putative [Heliomicrobium modesticaldum Ice1]